LVEYIASGATLGTDGNTHAYIGRIHQLDDILSMACVDWPKEADNG